MAYLIFFLQASITVSIINQTKLTTSHSGIYLTITTQKIAHNKNSTNKNIHGISPPIRRTMIFSLEILERNNDECILILVIYWKKTGLLHTKISNHNIIYS